MVDNGYLVTVLLYHHVKMGGRNNGYLDQLYYG